MTINLSDSKNEDFWEVKPFWCQPWSIILSGMMIVALSFLWPHKIWFSALIFSIVLAWWYLFLIVVPANYKSSLRKTNLDSN